jgi:ATP-binding cassette subfamily F protein 3
MHMVPSIRNILGGFLFSGDDVDKPVRVLSGGERTRLAVARMLLRPSNTLLLDEPTNHLDLDSKDVLLEALEDFGGTLIFVSHDRYFVDKLATKVIEIGAGHALIYPGSYEEFLWSRRQQAAAASTPLPAPKGGTGREPHPAGKAATATPQPPSHAGARPGSAPGRNGGQATAVTAVSAGKETAQQTYEDRRRVEAEVRREKKAADSLRRRIDDLEARIADREKAIKDIEDSMSAPGFYDDRDASRPVIDKHQALMWEVGDLMHQWEALQTKS